MAQAPAEQNTPAAVALPAPDRSRGVFETLLVRDGEPVELNAHLDRLAGSLDELFGAELPTALADQVRSEAERLELGRLRIVVRPPAGAPPSPRSRGAERVEIVTEAVNPADLFPDEKRGAELRLLPCPGGLGRHKWADRRPLVTVTPPAVPLLLDRGDEVLEAGRANVFRAHDGVLFTPADDGRILPGIARAAVIAAANEAGIEVREGPLTRADLFAADEVFLTGSVRGVEPARSLDGQPLPQIGELGRCVAVSLRRRWRTGRPSRAAGFAGRL